MRSLKVNQCKLRFQVLLLIHQVRLEQFLCWTKTTFLRKFLCYRIWGEQGIFPNRELRGLCMNVTLRNTDTQKFHEVSLWEPLAWTAQTPVINCFMGDRTRTVRTQLLSTPKNYSCSNVTVLWHLHQCTMARTSWRRARWHKFTREIGKTKTE